MQRPDDGLAADAGEFRDDPLAALEAAEAGCLPHRVCGVEPGKDLRVVAAVRAEGIEAHEVADGLRALQPRQARLKAPPVPHRRRSCRNVAVLGHEPRLVERMRHLGITAIELHVGRHFRHRQRHPEHGLGLGRDLPKRKLIHIAENTGQFRQHRVVESLQFGLGGGDALVLARVLGGERPGGEGEPGPESPREGSRSSFDPHSGRGHELFEGRGSRGGSAPHRPAGASRSWRRIPGRPWVSSMVAVSLQPGIALEHLGEFLRPHLGIGLGGAAGNSGPSQRGPVVRQRPELVGEPDAFRHMQQQVRETAPTARTRSRAGAPGSRSAAAWRRPRLVTSDAPVMELASLATGLGSASMDRHTAVVRWGAEQLHVLQARGEHIGERASVDGGHVVGFREGVVRPPSSCSSAPYCRRSTWPIFS